MADLGDQVKTNEEKAQRAWGEFFSQVDDKPPTKESLNQVMVVLTKNSVQKPIALGALGATDIEAFDDYKKLEPTMKGFLKRCAGLASALASVRTAEQQDAQRPVASPARQSDQALSPMEGWWERSAPQQLWRASWVLHR